MKASPRLYSRLTRSAASVGSYSSLWLGPDHFLQVTSTGYTESYQRFDFRDVQTFFICTSSRRLAWSWFLGAVLAIFAFVAAHTIADGEVPYFSGFFVLGALSLFVTNLVLGPTCCVYLVTRVQVRRLPSLVRRRTTERVIARLRPLIEQAQAEMGVSIPVLPEEPPVL